MKRVAINELQFKRLIDGVKRSVATDECRPILKYIQIKVKTDTITAYSLDGYRASRVEIKNDYPTDEEFTCYIKPFAVNVSKQGINPVVIEQTGAKTFVEVITEYGVIRYGFNEPHEEFIDVETIYKRAREHDRELGVYSRYLADALKSLSGIQRVGAQSSVVIESKADNSAAFIIRAKDDSIVNEQLILPVRLMGKK